MMYSSMDWFKAKITGENHTLRENPWFPADLPFKNIH